MSGLALILALRYDGKVRLRQVGSDRREGEYALFRSGVGK